MLIVSPVLWLDVYLQTSGSSGLLLYCRAVVLRSLFESINLADFLKVKAAAYHHVG